MSPLTRPTLAGLFLAAFFSSVLPALALSPQIAVDVNSGRVIEHRDAFQRWYPASLTKLMTMYVAFRDLKAGKLSRDTRVVMSKRAVGQPPSKMYFKPGATMTLDTAMKIIMVKSANDVSVAIAETVSGSLEAFVQRMNAEAARLGMRDTRFINPNGLPGKGQYTTARDMALLAMTLRRNYPEYAGYFALEGIQVGKKVLPNYNLLIGRLRGADGMKTGYICASGFNQVSSATRGGRTIVSVVLGTDSLASRAEASAALLEKGFKSRGKTKLEQLRPYGASRNSVADISGQICTKAARAERRKDRDKNGKLMVSSPYIRDMNRPPRAVMANLIVSSGPVVANVPVPTPKPTMASLATAFTPSNAPASIDDDSVQAALRPANGIPVPTPKPSL